MTANELRIGNIIKVPNHTAIVTDISTNEEGDSVRFRPIYTDKKLNIGYFLEVCEPIQLSEDLLLKFGFKYQTHLKTFTSEIETGWIEILPKIGNEEFVFYWKDSHITNIKYLHQLQNLYHALTGEELTLKN